MTEPSLDSDNTHTSNTTPIRIAIAEDHELARYGLTLTLDEFDQVQIVGEAENGQEAVELAKSAQPEIFLMDIGMPTIDGITATQQIKKAWPKIKVMMLTSHQDEDEVFAAMAAGADAYCMKDIKVDRLVQVMEMVLDGAVWLDPAIAQIILHALPAQPQQGQAQPIAIPEAGPKQPSPRKRYNADLTDREQQVLKLIVAGKSNKEIAKELDVTAHTAKAHVCNIIQKLAVDDRTQAAVKALQQGLVDPPSL
ncbi:MAG: response regulator transcription factor [Vampirovibrio sp.]|nr:response regulator transcription factor [Vampirovibrio sp.]